MSSTRSQSSKNSGPLATTPTSTKNSENVSVPNSLPSEKRIERLERLLTTAKEDLEELQRMLYIIKYGRPNSPKGSQAHPTAIVLQSEHLIELYHRANKVID